MKTDEYWAQQMDKDREGFRKFIAELRMDLAHEEAAAIEGARAHLRLFLMLGESKDELSRLRAENEALVSERQERGRQFERDEFRFRDMEARAEAAEALLESRREHHDACHGESIRLRAENSSLKDRLDLAEWNRSQAVKQWQSSEAKAAALTKERDEFERKGIELCHAYGNALIKAHDDKNAIAALTKDLSEMRERADRLQLEANKTFNLECKVAALTERVKELEAYIKAGGLIPAPTAPTKEK